VPFGATRILSLPYAPSQPLLLLLLLLLPLLLLLLMPPLATS
jgi:hypothetical protein